MVTRFFYLSPDDFDPLFSFNSAFLDILRNYSDEREIFDAQ